MAPPSRSVLIIDDEQSVRVALTRILEASGYLVSAAESGEAGLLVLERIPVHLVISDNHMPGMPGIDFLKLVRVRYPNVVRIMLTGDPDPETPVRSINEGEVYRFIRKQEKRQLISLVRKERRARETGSPLDPMDLEAELLLLAEEEARG